LGCDCTGLFSVQIFTYRPSPKNKPVQSQPNDLDKGCYENACYNPPMIAPPKPDFLQPGFRPSGPSPLQTGNASSSPVPFANTYAAPAGDAYAQYHLAYVAHRCDESGQHENHSFSRLASTLGIDVRSSFCDYRFGELPMSMPIGLTHAQVNLDDFPFEINFQGMTGWYSESVALQVLDRAEANETRLASANVSQLLLKYSKPIGNCRSGNLIVTNPPALKT